MLRCKQHSGGPGGQGAGEGPCGAGAAAWHSPAEGGSGGCGTSQGGDRDTFSPCSAAGGSCFTPVKPGVLNSRVESCFQGSKQDRNRETEASLIWGKAAHLVK